MITNPTKKTKDEVNKKSSLTHEAGVFKPTRPMPDLSKKDKSITRRLFRDVDKLNAISQPIEKFKIKHGTDEYEQAVKDYGQQVKDSITDYGKAKMTPASKKMLDSMDHYIEFAYVDRGYFVGLMAYIFNIAMKGAGLGVSSKTEELDKTSEQIVKTVIEAKIQSSL